MAFRRASLLPALVGVIVAVAACDGAGAETFEREVERDPTASRELVENGVGHRGPAPLDAAEVGGATLGAIPEVAERVVSSVVNISALRHTRSRDDERHPLYSDPLFRHFFGDPGAPAPRERLERSLGSGVIVDEDGVLLTNNHVVEGADEVLVSLTDGRELLAEVVGSDPQSDLAVLRIKDAPADLTPLPIGASSSLRLGQTVLAIGNPFGVGQTITMGIVSATGRGMGIVDYENFIQTDAAINPGNSGGALVNLKGELVGINTAILSRTGGYQGIGFAIPSDMARVIMEDLLEDGVVDRGFLGVQIQDLSADLAKRMALDAAHGALVARVLPDSPAADAGLRPGDVILAIDERPVRSAQDLKNIVGLQGAGARLSMTVEREGEERVLEVVLDAASEETRARWRRR